MCLFGFRDIKTSSMPLLKYPRKDCVIDFTYETITADEKPFSVTTVCVKARERERERDRDRERAMEGKRALIGVQMIPMGNIVMGHLFNTRQRI